MEVEICDPEDVTIDECLSEMRNSGVEVSFGKWLIDGSPSVILFDLESTSDYLNDWKANIWSVAGIPCPSNDQEMNDAILFGYMNAWFLGLVIFHKIYYFCCLYYSFIVLRKEPE